MNTGNSIHAVRDTLESTFYLLRTWGLHFDIQWTTGNWLWILKPLSACQWVCPWIRPSVNLLQHVICINNYSGL